MRALDSLALVATKTRNWRLGIVHSDRALSTIRRV
jgi:hypothetical protein